MALTLCRECGKSVGRSADACPFCGAIAPWSRKSPRRGNDALWVMGTLIIGGMLLFAFGCNSTSPDDSGLQNGRYDYQLDYNDGSPRHVVGDLIIKDATASSLTYFWDVAGFANPFQTAHPSGSVWTLHAAQSGGRAVIHTVSRSGNSYQCSVRLTLAGTQPLDGTCALTFEGPDSVRLSR